MVNTKQGAAKYDSTNQPFSFTTRHIHFQDKDRETTSPLSTHLPISSTPYKDTKTLATKLTIDLSHIHGLGSADKNSEAAAKTAAEVSLATAVQTVKEFRRLKDSKIPKLRGGYSSNAGLIFHSWKMDIEMEINENEYDNKSAI